jgi:thiamine kinase-like enzyme
MTKTRPFVLGLSSFVIAASRFKLDGYMLAPDHETFAPLLDYLASASGPLEGAWHGWRIARVAGAGNNLIYRATSAEHDLAIKFTIRDSRDRAGREYAALLALHSAGLAIAPAPLWLARERYAQPVVVQTWLVGEVAAAPPASDLEWLRLLDHYITVHCVTPAAISISIQPAVLNMHSVADGLRQIRQQLAYMPEREQPAELRELVGQVERMAWPEWRLSPFTLCRVDPNTLNFVRRSGVWASVDWENSGWGDPAYEIADLMTHPTYATVPDERWDWLIGAYCERRGEPAAATRIRVYYELMLIWWAARLARMLYEVPRGGDQRLSGRPEGWMEDARAKYQRYLMLAQDTRLSGRRAIRG